MLPVNSYTVTLTAFGSIRLPIKGRFFKIKACTGAVTVISDFGRLTGLLYGQGLEKTDFDYLLLTDATGAGNTVTVLIGDENFIDAQTGNFAVTANKAPQSSSFVNVNATVTNASAQLLPANAARQYLLIQNNGTASIYINFGAAATTANGVQIAAGGAFELAGTISTQAINAIGAIASNTAIVTVEG